MVTFNGITLKKLRLLTNCTPKVTKIIEPIFNVLNVTVKTRPFFREFP